MVSISNLQKGDIIYVLVPYNHNGDIDYRIEKTNLIRCEHVESWGESFVRVKFKYTDFENRRRIIDKKIHINQWNDEVHEAYKDRTGFKDYRYFKVWFSTDKDSLTQQYKTIFSELSTYTAIEIERLSRCREVYVDRLLTYNIEDYEYEQKV